MIKRIQKHIKTKQFAKTLTSILEYVIKSNGTIEEVEENKIIAKAKDIDIVIDISEEEIKYEAIICNSKETGIEKKYQGGYYARFISERNSKIYYSDVNASNELKEEKFILYDKNGNEKYLKEIFSTDNYIELNGVLKRREPRLLENISMKNYVWITEDKNAIKRRIVKYKYPDDVKKEKGIEDVDKCYFISSPINIDRLLENNKEEIEKDIYFKYFQKEITAKEIIERIRKK